MKEKETFSTGQMAEICNVTKTTVWNWIRNGKVPAFQTPGGRFMIRRSILLQFLKKHNMPIPTDLADSGVKKVLVVDDESGVVDVIVRKFAMESTKYELETASDGYEAGKKIAIFNPDLVILDIRMPGLDGFDVCTDIKQNPATEGIKVIAITGLPDEASIERIMECGADACFRKPLNLDDLRNIVDFLLFQDELSEMPVGVLSEKDTGANARKNTHGKVEFRKNNSAGEEFSDRL